MTTTDEGVLSLAAALTANSSMEYLTLYWSSTHPDSTLKKIGECVSKSTLRELDLVINMPSGEAPLAEERAKEWLLCVVVGGKELVQFQINSHLQSINLKLNHKTQLYFHQSPNQNDKTQLHFKINSTLWESLSSVNIARKRKASLHHHLNFVYNLV